MTTRRTATAILVLAAAGGAAVAELPKLIARPQPLPALPAYQYRPATPEVLPKPLLTGSSLPRLDVGTPDPLRPADPTATTTTTREVTGGKTITKGKKSERTEYAERTTTTAPDPQTADGAAATFALTDRVLRLDHCSVSGVSVALYPDGKYVVAFRADQNPQPSDPLTGTLTTRGRTADTGTDGGGMKRNRFYLTVRGYAADPLGERGAGGAKAAVLAIPLDPFWVERGEPYGGLAEGTSEAVKRNFKLVDRVEVDFTYR